MKRTAAITVLIAAALRFVTLAGALDGAEEWLLDITSGGKLAMASLSLGLGTEFSNEADLGEESGFEEILVAPEISAPPESKPSGEASDNQDHLKNNKELENAPEIKPTTIYGGLTISNATSFTPDIPSLIAVGWSGSLPSEGPQILIIHTHGSEAYEPEEGAAYEESDSGRTQNKNYNIIKVGDELVAGLEKQGLNVLHDREIYDYPSYRDSYARAEKAIEKHLQENPGIAIVIDVHRDALGSEDVVYKTVADIEGETSSQLMMLVGTGENGLPHPNWEENLKLALTLQSAVNQKYPSLARPVALKQERYNMHLTTGSMILEVGSSGNTLSEALCAVRLFAESAGPILTQMIRI